MYHLKPQWEYNLQSIPSDVKVKTRCVFFFIRLKTQLFCFCVLSVYKTTGLRILWACSTITEHNTRARYWNTNWWTDPDLRHLYSLLVGLLLCRLALLPNHRSGDSIERVQKTSIIFVMTTRTINKHLWLEVSNHLKSGWLSGQWSPGLKAKLRHVVCTTCTDSRKRRLVIKTLK